jgi:histidinol dehydrogenase
MHTTRDEHLRHRRRLLDSLQSVDLFRETLDLINAIEIGGEAEILAMYKRKGIRRTVVQVDEQEVQEGVAKLSGQEMEALTELWERCQRLARLEKEAFPTSIVLDDTEQVRSSLCYVPLETAGIYVPDRMPSSLILYCSLAQEAGVEHLSLALPPRDDGTIHPGLLAAASFFQNASMIAVGGKSAFPALAFGLGGHIPSKLFGPCSRFVDYVKQILHTFYKIPVDLPAGPSELVIFLDEEKDVSQAELDVRSQMEHGGDSLCFVISTKGEIIEMLRTALHDISPQVEYIQACDYAEAVDLINTIAPEILEIYSEQHGVMTPHIRHCGSAYANMPSPMGDYGWCGKGCSDATYGMAAGITGVTIESFYKGSCFSIGLRKPDSPEPWMTTLAELEQFPYHARAIRAYSK